VIGAHTRYPRIPTRMIRCGTQGQRTIDTRHRTASLGHMRPSEFANLDARVPAVAVDVAIFTVLGGELKVVLVKVKKRSYAGMWALPGGIIRSDESLEQAAYRELAEKTGLRNVYLEQLYTFGDVERDRTRRAVSTVYFALVNAEGPKLKTTEKYAGIEWFSVKRLPRLAYDHAGVIQYAVKRLRWKLEYTNVAWSLLPKTLTLTELQTVYEAILGKKLDKRNFLKKILSLKLLAPTGKMKRSGAHRPAELHRFKTRKPVIVKVL
jgi:8-oxo-dGTP diphosphatase